MIEAGWSNLNRNMPAGLAGVPGVYAGSAKMVAKARCQLYRTSLAIRGERPASSTWRDLTITGTRNGVERSSWVEVRRGDWSCARRCGQAHRSAKPAELLAFERSRQSYGWRRGRVLLKHGARRVLRVDGQCVSSPRPSPTQPAHHVERGRDAAEAGGQSSAQSAFPSGDHEDEATVRGEVILSAGAINFAAPAAIVRWRPGGNRPRRGNRGPFRSAPLPSRRDA